MLSENGPPGSEGLRKFGEKMGEKFKILVGRVLLIGG
jgi:hypothetical protein